MKKLTLLCLICSIHSFCFSQIDSTIVYKNSDGWKTTRDSATSYTVLKKLNDTSWYGVVYDIKTKALLSEGAYADISAKKIIGSFKNYSPAGDLENITEYNNGKRKEITSYYKTGNKKSHVSFDEKGNVEEQVGWDEAGNEIKNYIAFQQARFKGGDLIWRKFLEANLDRNISVKSGAGLGKHTVIIGFTVLTNGSLTNIHVVQSPTACPQCANEALRVFSRTPNWEAAIRNNEIVKSDLKQGITFVVAN